MSDLDKAWIKLKKEIWKDRWSFIRLILYVWAFLAGAVIEHYFPKLIQWLW